MNQSSIPSVRVTAKKRSSWLDLLKAFAILAVVLYHFDLAEFGYLGVDLFLVINGFLVTRGMMKESEAGSFSFFRFLYRRVLRLWPVLLVATAVCLGVGYFTMLPDDLENLAESVVASDVFANNILSGITVRDYWNLSMAYRPLMHTWYLGIVVQFYVLYALVFAVLKLFRDKWLTAARIVTAILFAVSLGLYLFPGSFNTFYWLPFRIFEFAAGALTALFGLDKKEGRVKRWFWLSLPMLLCLFFVPVLPVDKSVKLLLVVALSVPAVLFSTEYRDGKIAGFIPYRVLVWIGTASFSIYIWHQAVVAFYRYIFNAEMGVVDYVIVFAVTAAVSVASYFLVEKPLQKNQSLRSPAVILTAVLLVLTAGSGLYLYVRAGVVRDVPELNISTDTVQRGMNIAYCDRIYERDVAFADDDRIKVFATGDSYIRDTVNILLESEYADRIDVVYTFSVTDSQKNVDRIREADVILVNARPGGDSALPAVITENKKAETTVWFVGTKHFGLTNGNIYNRRFREDYLQSTASYASVAEKYEIEKADCAEHYIDFLAPVMTESGEVRVFTPEGKYISQDCAHLTRPGAQYYATLLNLDRILNGLE